jgi:hypothetical protein
MKDFREATLTDTPVIVEMIRALRKVTEETGTITKQTQSTILRMIPANVLIAVAMELDGKPSGFCGVLSGETSNVAVK